MADAKRVVPKFDTEAEEAKWWYDNREQHAEDLSREGKRMTREVLMKRIEVSKSVPIHVRLDACDLQLARELAERKGLPYQTYIKSLLHEALAREAGRAS